MAVQLSELRPDDYTEIIDLWQQTGNQSLDEATLTALVSGHHRFHSVLSLVARDQGQLVGAILCEMRARQSWQHHMAMRQEYLETGLNKRLLDKALLKLTAHGVHHCRIRLAQGTPAKPFWGANRWIDHDHPPRNSDDQDQPPVAGDSDEARLTPPAA